MAGTDELNAAVTATRKALDALSQPAARASTEQALKALEFAVAAASASSGATEAAAGGQEVGEIAESSFLCPRGKFAVKLRSDALTLVSKAAQITIPLTLITSTPAVRNV